MAFSGVNEGLLARIRAYVTANWVPEAAEDAEESFGHTVPASPAQPPHAVPESAAHFDFPDMPPEPEGELAGEADEDYDLDALFDIRPCIVYSEPSPTTQAPRPKPEPSAPASVPASGPKAAEPEFEKSAKKKRDKGFRLTGRRKRAAGAGREEASRPPCPAAMALHIADDADVCCSMERPSALTAAEVMPSPGFFDPYGERFQSEESFAKAVLRLIDEKGMTDPECYARANLSRAVFNKLKQSALNPAGSEYRPSKETALALTMGLALSLDEAKALLEKAGFALSHCSRRDLIVEYFLLNGRHDIFELNEVLYNFNQPPLGSF